MKKRRVYYRPEIHREAETTHFMGRKSDNLILIERMVQEALESCSIDDISSGSGLSAYTIKTLAKGKSSRVTRHVLLSVRAWHRRWKNGEPASAPAEQTDGTADAQPGASTASAAAPKQEPARDEASITVKTPAVTKPVLKAPATASPAPMKKDIGAAGRPALAMARLVNLPAIETEIARIQQRIAVLSRIRDLLAEL